MDNVNQARRVAPGLIDIPETMCYNLVTTIYEKEKCYV